MVILTVLEQIEGKLPKSSLVATHAAFQCKSTWGASRVVGLILGGGSVSRAAEEASRLGFDEVISVTNDALKNYLAVPYAAVVTQVAGDISASIIIAASTTQGKDYLPRVAQMLGAGQASDVLAFHADGSLRRPMYAGNVLADVRIKTEKKVLSIRTTAFDAAASGDAKAPIRAFDPAIPASSQTFVSYETVKSERPELTEAERVVSGGRALKSAENFEKLIAPLADALHAAIGASRAAVDSGYAPNDWQVGQTGKVVAPALYIAIGISGAIQHLAGMKDSKVIVAINTDPEAPIFEVADYGLVGDLFQVVPEMIAELAKINR